MADAGAVDTLLRALDLTGVFANGLLGGAVARGHRLDPVGFTALAIISGLGGGMVRDVLLQQGPPVALTDAAYLPVVLVAAAIAFLVRFEGRAWERLFPYVDALALGTWCAVGAQKTLLAGLGWLPAILLGIVTAVGGGAIRDVALGKVPAVFGGTTLYATCAFIGSALMVVLQRAGEPGVGLVVATLVAAGVCLGARWRGWMLPHEVAWERRPRTSRRPLRRRRRQPPE